MFTLAYLTTLASERILTMDLWLNHTCPKNFVSATCREICCPPFVIATNMRSPFLTLDTYAFVLKIGMVKQLSNRIHVEGMWELYLGTFVRTQNGYQTPLYLCTLRHYNVASTDTSVVVEFPLMIVSISVLISYTPLVLWNPAPPAVPCFL